MTELSCADVRAAAPELVLGTLDGAERGAVLAHVSGCPRCREDVAALADTVSDLALVAPPMAPSAGFTDRVLAAGGVTDQVIPLASHRRAVSRRRRWPVLVVAAAAVVALVFGLATRQTNVAGTAQLSAMIAPDGGVIGSLSATDGAVVVTVSYPSNWRNYTIEAVNVDGSTTGLGPLAWRDGAWRWQGMVPDPASVDRLRVVRPDGQVTCWGRLPAM